MEAHRPQSSSQTSSPTSSSLFQVFLRLRPPLNIQQSFPAERFLTVEPAARASDDSTVTPNNSRPATADTSRATAQIVYPQLPELIPSSGSAEPTHPPLQQLPPTHITIHPPTRDSRKRAVEKFAFTRVFEEACEQIDLFEGINVTGLVEGVLKGDGRDGLLATLGVTGSGKSHTILGSKSQRGILQLSLDVLYRSIGHNIIHPSNQPSLIGSLCATDPSEAQIFAAQTFLENVYGSEFYGNSRATTPMVGASSICPPLVPSRGPKGQWSILGIDDPSISRYSERLEPVQEEVLQENTSPKKSRSPFIPRMKGALAKLGFSHQTQDTPMPPRRRFPPRPAPALIQSPDITNITVPVASKTEYCILVSMYEVYNDRIFDLLATPANAKDLRRRHLLFKPTEASPDRKVVAGLKKVVCGSYEEALMILETGLLERRVAGTGSNSVSSRSHGFFCVEVKRRIRGGMSSAWNSATLTIVDLAGSERARNAKTAGATLAEAGKINESLMYLGQCLQMQSDQSHDGSKPTLVPFRQCKLTELLFSNSFPNSHSTHLTHHRNPQKAIMVVTADPLGDFNATSQILRYSALAREVTVPRIPSVSSTILAGIDTQRTPSVSSQSSPRGPADESMMDIAFSEINRLNEEVEVLNIRLAEEEMRRHEAETNWQRADERAEIVEMEIREECWAAVEVKMEDERRRWVTAWGEETDRHEEHLDRKIDLMARADSGVQKLQVHEDEGDVKEYVSRLEAENETLKKRLDNMERELQCKSPTKSGKRSLRPAGNKQQPAVLTLPSLGLALGSPSLDRSSIFEDAASKQADDEDSLTITNGSPGPNGSNGRAVPPLTPTKVSLSAEKPALKSKTPATTGKKVRKLTARKWDLMDENEFESHGLF